MQRGCLGNIGRYPLGPPTFAHCRVENKQQLLGIMQIGKAKDRNEKLAAVIMASLNKILVAF